MPWPPTHRLVLAVAAVVAAAVVVALERPDGRWQAHLRKRFLLSLPLGTLVTATFVLAVYLFVQGGYGHWYAPVTIPFRAWSYYYPLGMLTASFSHVGPNHLLGNLVGLLTLGTIAEYAWGHYPSRRGAATFSSWRTNPYVRALVVVPGAMLLVGVVTILFAIGPVIGFSGVVFALGGFALVFRPYTTVLALSAGSVLRLSYTAVVSPTAVGESRPVFSSPWWADIAIQGHALGLLTGILLAILLVRTRSVSERPSPLRLWVGVLFFAVWQSLWAVYWFRGEQQFVLYRAVGLGLVFALATVVTVAVTASDRPLFDVPDYDVGEAIRTIPRWQVGVAVLVFVTAAVAGPAVPVNLYTAESSGLPGETVEVRDYEVTYAENVENGMISTVDVEAFGESTSVNTSGVVVRSEERNIWLTAVTKGRLAFEGRSRVDLGGVGWRESVVVERDGWKPVGGNASYRVRLTHDNRTFTSYTSPPATADPVIAGRNFTVEATADGFDVVVRRPTETARAPVPAENASVVLDGILIVNTENGLVASAGGTRVTIAKEEVYEGREF
jgi:membrane associated rhomboid family serine protease/signal peptidase I